MIDGLILSFQLFSRIPISKPVAYNLENRRKALFFLPLVGLVIGFLTGLVLLLLGKKSSLVGAGFAFLAYCIFSGSIHLDGLADSCDGFLSNRNPDRIIDIMSDAMTGSFGALALIAYAIIKFSLYASLTGNVLVKLALVSAISRSSSIYIISRGPTAKPGGFGDEMREALLGYRPLVLIEILVLALVFAIFLQARVILFFLAMVGLSELVNYRATKRIGGLTGDIYGANAELNELLALTLVFFFLN